MNLLGRIWDSPEPDAPIEEAVSQAPVLEMLNQRVFSSLFSTYVPDRPPDWTAKVAECALRLMTDREVTPPALDWLLETAFHASLALVGRRAFYSNVTRIETVLERHAPQDPSRSFEYVRGLLAYARDDLTAAERAFNVLPELSPMRPPAYKAGVAAFRAPGFYRTLASYDPSIELTFARDLANPSGGSILVVCAVDDVYLGAFADDFVSRVLDVCPTACIHFHIVNNDVELAKATRLNVLACDRVSVSVGHTTDVDPGTYATMARFIILPMLMQRWRKPILVSDIDLVMRSDPSALEGDESVVLGFSHIPGAAYLPASAIQAGHTLFRPSRGGDAFASLLSKYLHYMCAHRRGLWGTDQVALLSVWRMLGRLIDVDSFSKHAGYSYGPMADRLQRREQAKERLAEVMARGARA